MEAVSVEEAAFLFDQRSRNIPVRATESMPQELAYPAIVWGITTFIFPLETVTWALSESGQGHVFIDAKPEASNQ